MRTQKIKNRTVIIFAAFVYVVCDTTCTKICSKNKSYSKKT